MAARRSAIAMARPAASRFPRCFPCFGASSFPTAPRAFCSHAASLVTVNPATGERLSEYPTMSDEHVAKLLVASDSAAQAWGRVPIDSRASVLKRIAALLRERAPELAALTTSEMGKPIAQSRAEVEKCAFMCEHIAETGAEYLAPREVKTAMSKSMVSYEPLGVIFAIMPWNFPIWQVIRFAAPTLMAGNGAVLSHAPISTGCALALERLLLDAGVPESVFTSLVIDPVPQAQHVIAHPAVRAVALTGSGRAGRAVAAECAKHLKKCVLELGGSDPYLILSDADVDAAAEVCVNARMLCSGQVCISPKRLIAVDEVYDRFEQKVLELARGFKVGDPCNDDTKLGPLARADLRDTLHDQVTRSVSQGAECLLGGSLVPGPGNFYPATVLRNIDEKNCARKEEFFGPVICLFRAKDEEDAVRMANDSDYGLGAAVFTADEARGERLARERLQAGVVAVNTFVASDPRLPFGGVKQSGYGRECAGEGMRELCNVKTLNVK